MNALHTLIALGAICFLGAHASATERKLRLRELYKFDPASGPVLAPAPPPPKPLRDEEVRWQDPKPLDDGIRLGKRLSLVPIDDIDLPELSIGPARPDLLPNSLMKAYRGGFTVRIPGVEDPMTMYIRSGLSWDVGKGRRLVLPYVSRHIGFRFKMDF